MPRRIERAIAALALAASLAAMTGCAGSAAPMYGVLYLDWDDDFVAGDLQYQTVAMGGVVGRGSPRSDGSGKPVEATTEILSEAMDEMMPRVGVLPLLEVESVTRPRILEGFHAKLADSDELPREVVRRWGRILEADLLLVGRIEDSWFGHPEFPDAETEVAGERGVVVSIWLHDLRHGDVLWSCTVEEIATVWVIPKLSYGTGYTDKRNVAAGNVENTYGGVPRIVVGDTSGPEIEDLLYEAFEYCLDLLRRTGPRTGA